jgi:two-component system LytT family response regulator
LISPGFGLSSLIINYSLDQSFDIKSKIKNLNLGKFPGYFLVLGFVIILAIVQDYLYSRLQNTGFYLEESLLYNSFWLFFLPFSLVIKTVDKYLFNKTKVLLLTASLGIGAVCSILHIFLFASLFMLVSKLVFTPSHRFITIFNSALSNQFYIAFLYYTLLPSVILFFRDRKKEKIIINYPENISIKFGKKIKSISVSDIQLITTDKPYAAVYVGEDKMLFDKSLIELEKELNPLVFIRVHRSAIVNLTFIKEMNSRSNGDYDGLLLNGQSVRFSRHYRNNWAQLLQ